MSRRFCQRLVVSTGLLLGTTAVLAQAPGAGWAVKPTPPRQVAEVYWDLHTTTEVWTRIELRRPTGVVAPVDLVVQATWPGRRRTAAPHTIRLLAQGGPLAVVFSPGFALTLADEHGGERTLDLTGRPFESQLVFPFACDDCSFNGVDSRIPASVLMELTQAAQVTGTILGIDVELQPEDLSALRAFAKHVGLDVEDPSSERVRPPVFQKK